MKAGVDLILILIMRKLQKYLFLCFFKMMIENSYILLNFFFHLLYLSLFRTLFFFNLDQKTMCF